jgi:hypothetical protein
MTKLKQMWREKWLSKEEGGSSSDSSGEEASKVNPARGEDNWGLGDGNSESGNYNPESGNCYPVSGNRNPNLGNSNPSEENDWQGEEPVPMVDNMVFTILVEFHAPTEDVMELALGVERAVFDKPKSMGMHMKPLLIRGHLDETPIRHMPFYRVGGGAGRQRGTSGGGGAP